MSEQNEERKMRPEERYFVVPAPGHYGDRARVISAHRSLAAARRSAGAGYVVRVGALRRGDVFYRSSERVYPLARNWKI